MQNNGYKKMKKFINTSATIVSEFLCISFCKKKINKKWKIS